MKEFFKKLFTKENMKKFFFSFIWLMVLVFALDIMSKWLVVNHFGVEAMKIGSRNKSDLISIIPNFLYIGGSINPKMAFSLGPDSRVFFIIVSVVLSTGLIAFYVWKYKKLNVVERLSITLMISGAIGNLIDRSFYWDNTVGFSGVIDWIQVFFGNYAFPMFNLADSALVVGVVILLIFVIVEAIKDARKDAKDGRYKYSPKELKEAEETKNEENKDK